MSPARQEQRRRPGHAGMSTRSIDFDVKGFARATACRSPEGGGRSLVQSTSPCRLTQPAELRATLAEEQQLEPEHPAPTLTLAADGSEETGTATASSASAADGSDGTATTALVLAVPGLVAGLDGLAPGWPARPRTVSM